MVEMNGIAHDVVELGVAELDRAAGAYHPYKFDSGLFNSVVNSDDPAVAIVRNAAAVVSLGVSELGYAANEAERRNDLTVMTEPLGNFVGGHLPGMIPASRGLMTRILETPRAGAISPPFGGGGGGANTGTFILPPRPSEPIRMPDIPPLRLPTETDIPATRKTPVARPRRNAPVPNIPKPPRIPSEFGNGGGGSDAFIYDEMNGLPPQSIGSDPLFPRPTQESLRAEARLEGGGRKIYMPPEIKYSLTVDPMMANGSVIAYELPHDLQGGEVFGDLLQQAKNAMLNSPNKRVRENAEGVLWHSPEFYQDFRLFVSPDLGSGISLGIGPREGYIGSLFTTPESGYDTKSLQNLSVQEGGRWAVYYGKGRAKMYGMGGMMPIARVPYGYLKDPPPLTGNPDLYFGYLSNFESKSVKYPEPPIMPTRDFAQALTMQVTRTASLMPGGTGVVESNLRTLTPVTHQLPADSLTSMQNEWYWQLINAK